MNLPWKKKKSKEPITAKTALGAIRQLYNHYQKQANMWGYALLSSLVLVFLWIEYEIRSLHNLLCEFYWISKGISSI